MFGEVMDLRTFVLFLDRNEYKPMYYHNGEILLRDGAMVSKFKFMEGMYRNIGTSGFFLCDPTMEPIDKDSLIALLIIGM